MELTTRKEKVLSSIIGAYIRTGEPVGSKGIAAELGVSSATVRNEMADLISLGLLEQPHTSAGRVPSQAGYRLFVDRLMKPATLTEQEKKGIDSRLYAGAYDPEKLLTAAARLLAEVTRCAAVATIPSGRDARVKALQFVQTSRRTAMVIMISSAGTMKTRVFRCDFDLSSEIMRIFFRVINEKLVNRPVAEITPALTQSLAVAMGDMSMLMPAPLMAVYEVAQDTMHTVLCTAGQLNLLLYPELAGSVRGVNQLLERPQEVAALLQRAGEDTRVMIGRETGRVELSSASLLTARYRVDGEAAGYLAVVGPTRMDYPRYTACIGYVAQSIGQMLAVLMKEE